MRTTSGEPLLSSGGCIVHCGLAGRRPVWDGSDADRRGSGSQVTMGRASQAGPSHRRHHNRLGARRDRSVVNCELGHGPGQAATSADSWHPASRPPPPAERRDSAKIVIINLTIAEHYSAGVGPTQSPSVLNWLSGRISLTLMSGCLPA